MENKRDFETIVRELDARQQIHDCMMRYCRGVDQGDTELAASAYHPDANDNHGSYNGPAEGFLKISLDPANRGENLRHLICNEYVEFDEVDPSVAHSETAVVGCFQIRDGDSYHMSALACRYLDRFEERDGKWGIADRRLVLDWEVDGPVRGLAGSALSSGMLRGIWEMSDPAYGHGFKLWGDAERPPVSTARIGDNEA